MISGFRAFLLAILLIVASAAPALADTRVALVIANSAYRNVPRLTNPANDGPGVAAALRTAGFTNVTVLKDLDQQGLRRALQEFAAVARDADLAVLYFAGHGIEVGGENYLLPVEARLATNTDVAFEAVPLDLAMQATGGARKLGVVMLDACRNNPFTAGMRIAAGSTRSVGRGLTRVEPLGNTLVVYAAREGTTAEDGSGTNSPFAKALIRRLPTPGVEVSLLFRQVRDDVLAETSNRQQPFVYGSLGGEPLYLAAAPTLPRQTPTTSVQAAADALGPSQELAPEVQRAVAAAARADRQAKEKAAEARKAQALALDAAAQARTLAQRATRGGQPGLGVLEGTGTDPDNKPVTWRYAGQVANGLANGLGVKTWSNGEVNEGQWVGGTMSGYIVNNLVSGARREGQHASDVALLVVMTFTDGDSYQGAFTNGEWSLGVYYGGASRTYVEKSGLWTDSNLHGYGIIRWKDGRRSEGAFKAGALSGPGVTFDVLGEVAQQGVFEDDKLKTAQSR